MDEIYKLSYKVRREFSLSVDILKENIKSDLNIITFILLLLIKLMTIKKHIKKIIKWYLILFNLNN